MSEANTRALRIKEASVKRREQKKRETKQAILEAATELFLEQGHEAFSLRQVSEAIGYSPTTIYLYFKDKEDLLFNAGLEGFVKFTRALQEAYDSTTDPWERLLAEGEAYIKFGLENPVHYRLMFMGQGEFLSKDMLEEDCSTIDESFQILHRTVQEALSASILKPGNSEAYAALIWAGVHGIVSLSLGTKSLSKDQAYGLFQLYKEINMMTLKQT